MDVVPHRSAPTIKKLGSIRARRSGRPAVTRPHRATRLPRRCQPVAAGRALRCSAQARPPVPASPDAGLDVVSWLGLIPASSRGCGTACATDDSHGNLPSAPAPGARGTVSIPGTPPSRGMDVRQPAYLPRGRQAGPAMAATRLLTAPFNPFTDARGEFVYPEASWKTPANARTVFLAPGPSAGGVLLGWPPLPA